ncbi:MAG: hypothetical protein JWR16_1843 [Nevskia sp.]|nr:hypothetical protein [Nevskia sp.]
MNDKKTEREIDETLKATFPSSDPAPWGGADRSAQPVQQACDKAKRRPPKLGEDERC